jgi:malonyl-CoA decarboxylase
MFDAVADLGRQYLERSSRSSPVAGAAERCRDLMSPHGEASGTALAHEIVELYREMDAEQRFAFLDMLASEWAPDEERVKRAAEEYLKSPGQEQLIALSRAAESPRQELLRRLNIAPGGTAMIVKMREAILSTIDEKPHWRALEVDLRHLLTSWFNRGFLQFARIDWHTPAVVLEKLFEYEAVHEINGWDDLRRRLAEDRRCFAFFHPALPDEPLIFVEVALTHGMADKIAPLLSPPTDGERKEPADTAVFYSINSCQDGLTGISFGDLLIKQVVDALKSELPRVRKFCTLSPIPGFRAWLERAQADSPLDPLAPEERALFLDPHWADNEMTRRRLQKPLMSLCARYLVQEKRNGRPIDPVARFHLGNGASIERINWAGDLSDKGIRQSFGMMVNYLYDVDDIVENHEAYVKDRKIAVSAAVRSLLPSRKSNGSNNNHKA